MESPEHDLAVLGIRAGDIVAGRYRVGRVLGGGGMSVVVAADQLELEREVALKFVHPRFKIDEASVERLRREARAIAALKSEHVVRVLDLGILDSGIAYLAMECLEGIDLGEVMARRGTRGLPIPVAVEYVIQACVGIAEAHAAGIVHRDLKPANLFLTHRSDGTSLVKIFDFGIAKLVEHSSGAASLTVTGDSLGSPRYMAPEQVRDSRRVDVRTDIWALGIVLYELVTGCSPIRGDTPQAVCASIIADRPIPLRKRLADVPRAFERIVARCLAKPPERRFRNVAELARALEPLAGASSKQLVRRIEDTLGEPYPDSGAAAAMWNAWRTQKRAVATAGLDAIATTLLIGIALSGAQASSSFEPVAGSAIVEPLAYRDARPPPPLIELRRAESIAVVNRGLQGAPPQADERTMPARRGNAVEPTKRPSMAAPVTQQPKEVPTTEATMSLPDPMEDRY